MTKAIQPSLGGLDGAGFCGGIKRWRQQRNDRKRESQATFLKVYLLELMFGKILTVIT